MNNTETWRAVHQNMESGISRFILDLSEVYIEQLIPVVPDGTFCRLMDVGRFTTSIPRGVTQSMHDLDHIVRDAQATMQDVARGMDAWHLTEQDMLDMDPHVECGADLSDAYQTLYGDHYRELAKKVR